MRQILKTLLLILSISLVKCKEPNNFSVVELENEPAIVRIITENLPEYFEDELFYLELVNPHAKLRYTALTVVMLEGYENSEELFDPYKIEGLAVKVSGLIVRNLTAEDSYSMSINGIYFHGITLFSIEIDE